MEDQLPSEIVWRKDKIGFEPPQKTWMSDPQLQDYVQEGRKILVGEKILKKEVLNKKNQPMDAHAADNFDWRYLVTAKCIF
jgi:asparagine synthase (glutamine-hydrolysing)